MSCVVDGCSGIKRLVFIETQCLNDEAFRLLSQFPSMRESLEQLQIIGLENVTPPSISAVGSFKLVKNFLQHIEPKNV